MEKTNLMTTSIGNIDENSTIGPKIQFYNLKSEIESCRNPLMVNKGKLKAQKDQTRPEEVENASENETHI